MKLLNAAILSAAAIVAAPLAAHATTFQFNAQLAGANERPTPNGSSGTGVATLFYNDFNTASLADDNYDFSMSVFGLTQAPTAYHIHAPGDVNQVASVRVNLDQAPFVSLVSGTTLLVGGNDITPPSSIPAQNGHPSMSLLDALQASLAYVNVHTTTFPSGEVRGQLVQVAAVPEPETYAMLLAGLGVLGFALRRRKGEAHVA